MSLFYKSLNPWGKELLYSHPEETGIKKFLQTSPIPWALGRVEEAEVWSQSQEQREAVPRIKQPTRKAASPERDGHIVRIDRNISSLHKDSWAPSMTWELQKTIKTEDRDDKLSGLPHLEQ